MLRIVDKVLVMSVNPGNAGQMFLPYVGEKIPKFEELKAEMNFKLYWDGACTAERVKKYAHCGIDGFVLGTSLLFGHDKSYTELIKEVRALA
jgi:ribulose-phosphate 3-epimerase